MGSKAQGRAERAHEATGCRLPSGESWLPGAVELGKRINHGQRHQANQIHEMHYCVGTMCPKSELDISRISEWRDHGAISSVVHDRTRLRLTSSCTVNNQSDAKTNRLSETMSR